MSIYRHVTRFAFLPTEVWDNHRMVWRYIWLSTYKQKEKYVSKLIAEQKYKHYWEVRLKYV